MLLDFARLIAAFQRQRAIDVPVITFGGSYGAMLSFWLRATYPHAVAGAIVASGPLRVFHGWHLTMVKVAVLPCQAMPCQAMPCLALPPSFHQAEALGLCHP